MQGATGLSDIYGAEGSRTPYLLNAIQALSQLSYSPNTTRIFKYQSGKPGSNRRPSRWQRDALPTELFPRPTLWNGVDGDRTRDLRSDSAAL
jgi:hypothetical protein